MPVAKLSISLDAELAEQVRRIADVDGMSVSALIADTLAERLRRRALQEALDGYQSEHGAFTDEELERQEREDLARSFRQG